jgi:hypothetical protein
MNVAELAKTMGVSRQWLNKMVDRGLVPGVNRSEVTGRLIIAQDVTTEKILLFQKRLRDAYRPLGETLRRLRSVPVQKRREFNRMIRTTTLISRLLSGEFEEKLPDEYRACNELPIQEAIKLLRNSKPFMNFKVLPLVEWAVSARTEKSFEMRCAIVEYEHARNPEQFRSQIDIAERFDVTRSAVSKVFNQMPPFKRSSERQSRSWKRPEA